MSAIERWPTPEKIVQIDVEPDFADFVPEEFKKDPLKYFEQEGKNIKPGETEFDENGMVREDPHATKDLPVWRNGQGNQIFVVGKKVNVTKSEIGRSGDPFYEYKIMKTVLERGLPAPKPVARAICGLAHIIVMEKVEGIRYINVEEIKKRLINLGYTEEEILELREQAKQKMEALKQKFEEKGIFKKRWKLEDLVIEVDFENKKILSVFPVDWERTVIK